MAVFQLEIAFLLELAVFAAGLVLLHLGRQQTAPLLRAAGFVLVVGGVLTAACTGYFGVRYHVQGEFDHAYAHHPPRHERTEHRHEDMDPQEMREMIREHHPELELEAPQGEQ
jgi:hypothetical protein